MSCRITGTGTRVPEHVLVQSEIFATALAPYFGGNPKAEKIFAHPAIATRHSVLDDAAGFFASRPGAGARNAVYADEAPRLAEGAATAALEASGVAASELDAFVAVTCTGYMTPGLDILVARALGMREDMRRFALGGMGCYATFPALALARQALLSGTCQTALVTSTELCSLHFQAEDDTDNVVSTSLFADGSGAVLLEAGPGPGWHVLDCRTATLYDTGAHMTWHLTDTGFRMYLSSYVPLILKESILAWLAGWLAEHGLGVADVAHWGIHPGGPRILDGLQQVLGLTDGQMAPSRGVLRDFGNMSSATIVFILERLSREGVRDGDHAVLLAFGPGLTMEGALLRYEAP